MIKMTEQERKEIREHSRMSAFTFYLDDLTKLEVLERLRALGLNTKKGSISALIRTLLHLFATSATSTLSITEEELVRAVEQEYLLTSKKNKRSTL